MKPNAMVQFHFFHLLSVQGIFLLGIVDLMDEISLVDTSYDILRVIGAVVHCSKYVQNVMRTMEAVLKELWWVTTIDFISWGESQIMDGQVVTLFNEAWLSFLGLKK